MKSRGAVTAYPEIDGKQLRGKQTDHLLNTDNGSGSVRRRFLGGALWNVAGTALGRALYLVGLVLAARFLGREDYGRLWAVYSMALYLGSLVGWGFGVPATKLVAEHRGSWPELAGAAAGMLLAAIAIVGTAAAAMLWASAGWVAVNILLAPEMDGALRLAAVPLPLAAVHAVQAGILAGAESFPKLALAEAVQGTALVLSVAWLVPFYDLEGAVLALAVAGLMGCALQQFFIAMELRRSGATISLKMTPGQRLSVFRPAAMLSLAGLAAAAAYWATNAMLASKPGGFGEMGMVNIGMQWMNAVLFVPTLLAQVGLPVLAERRSAGDEDGLRDVFRINLLLVAISSVIAAGLAAGAGGIILGFYGPEFSDGRTVLAVMALAGGVSALCLPAFNLLLARGLHARYLAMTVAWALALVACFNLMSSQGALGLALAHLSSGIILLTALWIAKPK